MGLKNYILVGISVNVKTENYDKFSQKIVLASWVIERFF